MGRLRTKFFGVLVLAAMLLGASPALGQEDFQAPFIEMGLGATNMEATLGNQRLTAGVSRDGDLSMLSWPSPSYWDQLHYITSNAPDARTRPRFGAPERAGAFAGLVLMQDNALKPTVTYFRDWEREVSFLQDDVSIVETTFTSDQYGFQVVQWDIIPPEHDVLIRRYEVTRQAGAPQYDDVSLLSYANLSPGLSKLPQIPLLDVLMDHQNDFLGVWHDTEQAILQFHPNDTGIIDSIIEATNVASKGLERDFGPLGDLLKSQSLDGQKVQDLAGKLDANYAKGVYAAMSASPAPQDYQIGEDPTDFCAMLDEIATNITELQQRRPGKDLPADPAVADIVRCKNFDPLAVPRQRQGWQHEPTDAFEDAKDGALRGNALAGAQVNTAMRVPLNFGENGASDTAQAALYFAFGESSSEALGELNWARGESLDAIQTSRVQEDENYVKDLWIPQEITGAMRAFVKRAFLNMRVGTDAESGAIVASVSRQPSYQLDWPRDGAFFNIALDLAGQHDLVTKRMKFYSETMRKEPKPPVALLNQPAPGWPDKPNERNFPPHSWEMNYYADGMVGGNIRLEIDNTALLIWAYVDHVGHLPEDERDAYIQQVWPTVEKATEFVHGWRDPKTGLMWPANEDDHAAYTQGLQGAETSYLALVAASRLAKRLGKDDLVDKWTRRAGELRNATLHYMGDEEHGFVDYKEDKPAAGRVWLSWPTHFLPADHPKAVQTLDKVLERNLQKVRGERGNGNYPTKAAISAAIAYAGNDAKQDKREDALEIAERLATKIANQNTYTIGESIVPVDEDGDGETDDFINGVSPPHLWSAILVYLTAVAYHHPDRFDPYRDVLPEVEVPDVTPPGVDQGDGGDAGDVGADVGDVGASADAGQAGSDAGEDAGEDADGGDQQSPEDEGCNCAQSGGTPGGGALLAVLVGAFLWRRRR